MLNSDDLVILTTYEGARVLDLNDGRGRIREGGPADLLLLPYRSSASRSLIDATPSDIELVLTAGVPGIACDAVARQLGLNGARWPLGGLAMWVRGDFERLVDSLSRRVPKDILDRNSLWQLLTESGRSDAAARAHAEEILV